MSVLVRKVVFLLLVGVVANVCSIPIPNGDIILEAEQAPSSSTDSKYDIKVEATKESTQIPSDTEIEKSSLTSEVGSAPGASAEFSSEKEIEEGDRVEEAPATQFFDGSDKQTMAIMSALQAIKVVAEEIGDIKREMKESGQDVTGAVTSIRDLVKQVTDIRGEMSSSTKTLGASFMALKAVGQEMGDMRSEIAAVAKAFLQLATSFNSVFFQAGKSFAVDVGKQLVGTMSPSSILGIKGLDLSPTRNGDEMTSPDIQPRGEPTPQFQLPPGFDPSMLGKDGGAAMMSTLMGLLGSMSPSQAMGEKMK